MMKELNPEERLLLETIREENSADFYPGINWAKFLSLSRKARVSAVIYYRWKGADFLSLVPPEIFAALENDFYKNLSRNTLIQKFAGGLFEEINRHIKIIPLKGIVFMEKLYPHSGMRMLTDVDLLVKKEDFEKLEEILNAYGGRLAAKLPYAAVFAFGVVNLDISWNLFAIERFIKAAGWSDEEVWLKAGKEKICGQDVLVLPPEDALLHLIYHQAFQHCFRNFLGYLDIAKLIKQGAIDWDCFLKRIIKLGLSAVAKKELEFCRDYLRAKVPEEILSSLKGKFWNQIVFRGFSELAPLNLDLSCPHLIDWLRQPFFWDRFNQTAKTCTYGVTPTRCRFLR